MQQFIDNLYQASNTGQIDLQKIENAVLTLKSCFSGASAPSNPVAGMLWMDTGTLSLKVYSGSVWQTIWNVTDNRTPASSVVASCIAALTATIAEINTVCDGSIAKNSHSHALSDCTGYVGATQLADGTVRAGKLEDGTSQVVVALGLDRDAVSYDCTGSATYVSLYTFYLYIPTYADYMQWTVEGKRSTGTGYVRIYIGSTNYAQMDDYSLTSYVRNTGNVDVSSLSGWQACSVRVRSSVTATVYARGVSGMFYYS